jgi:hypothetical protein
LEVEENRGKRGKTTKNKGKNPISPCPFCEIRATWRQRRHSTCTIDMIQTVDSDYSKTIH